MALCLYGAAQRTQRQQAPSFSDTCTVHSTDLFASIRGGRAQRSSERPLPPSAWPSNKLGQRGVFAIKWTVLLIHKTPIIKVILVQFPLQSLRTSYVSPGSMTERLWWHPAEVPFSTVAFGEASLAGGLLTFAAFTSLISCRYSSIERSVAVSGLNLAVTTELGDQCPRNWHSIPLQRLHRHICS